MKKGDSLYNQYIEILKEELRPAMGCTEPIALAYAAAKARQVLGCIPDKIRCLYASECIYCSYAARSRHHRSHR